MAPGPGMRRGSMNKGKNEKPKDIKKALRRLISYFKNYKVIITTIIIFAVLSTIFSIIGPKVLGKATTELFTGLINKFMGKGEINYKYIGTILLILGGLYIVSAIFSYIQQYMMAGVSQKIVYNMRKEVNDKINKLPLKYYDKNSKGDLLSRTTNDIENVSSIIGQAITQVIISVATLIGILVMMISINLILSIITVLIIPISIMFIAFVTKKSQKYFEQQWKLTGDLNGHVEEMFTGHQIIKAYGKEEEAIEKFERINQDLYKVSWKAQFVSGIIKPIIDFGSNINYVIICAVGAIKVTSGSLNIGDIQAFIQYSKQFNQPIAQLSNIINNMQSAIASAERVFELLDEEEEVKESETPKELKEVKGLVQIETVDFSYVEEAPLIQNMNLEVKPGEKIAIVGPTGAGKTTIVNLLMRFYDVQKGKIKVDGVDIKEMKRGYLRRLFGMVLQDTWLFNGTIKENIAYGNDKATDEQVENAAKMAHVSHFIKTMPQGYDTILDDDASNISQGQKQLLTIARAFLADNPIIILDEATSSVDTRTERLIQKAMDELMKGRTSFVIAHRLSTIKNADKILVMNEGSIIETGTHDELMQKNGFYSNLYNSQFTECIDNIA
ncbi:MAG: ABC transporter ATP-binding protein [Clostridia bacterium]|nr:ABC transporter ATP-binding protein [Clostridia bacterium]MDD4375998.1 ABC transporter ATP-binding protein [Clostridia bacterium]